MKQGYPEPTKREVVERWENKETAISISEATGVPRCTFYRWIQESTDSKENESASEWRFNQMEKKLKRMEGLLEIIKKSGCSPSDPLKVKLPAMESLGGQYNVHMLCDSLEVPRGTYYNFIKRNKRDNTWYAKRREYLRVKIQQIYDNNRQILGAAKICSILREQGDKVSVEMVRELMRDMGLISIRDGAKDQYEKEQKRYKNYLNQQFDVTRPNEVWVSDVTYFRFKGNDYFICAIIDLYARMVIGYRVGKMNSTQLVKSTFPMAYKSRNPVLPLIFHTDRGGKLPCESIL